MTGVPHVTAKGRKKGYLSQGHVLPPPGGKGRLASHGAKFLVLFRHERPTIGTVGTYYRAERETAEGCFIYLDSCVSSSLGVKNIDFKIQEVLWLHAVCGPIRGEGEDGCWWRLHRSF